MKLHTMGNRKQIGYTTWGCMWQQGVCRKDTEYVLQSGGKKDIPMQSRVTAFWQDGSVKWTAHTADASLLGEEIEVLPGKPEKREAKIVVHKNQATPEVLSNHDNINGSLEIQAGNICVQIPGDGRHLFSHVTIGDKEVLRDGELQLLLEHPVKWQGGKGRIEKEYISHIQETVLEEEGSEQVIVRFGGCHMAADGECRIPFVVRMKIGADCERLDFVHTFLYDGDEDTDFLKGIGIRCKAPLSGPFYNRHVKFMGDYGVFHESVAELVSWKPRVPAGLYESQMKGNALCLTGEEEATVNEILQAMPFWSEYTFCQKDEHSFAIQKKLKEDNCCYLDCLHGQRSQGGAAFGSEAGSVLFSIKDFWEKYPSGYTFKDLDGEEAEAVIWLWSPQAEAMDFRHYANRGYNKTYYEGYDYKGATPYGIACTSECSIAFSPEMIPDDKVVQEFAESVKYPVQYVGDPAYYHSLRAFGYWSLPEHNTPMEQWLEEQLNRAVAFYRNEVEQRGWYGMFNYGDFMHTYDKERHQWRYDMGGFAWDNTELVPTLWLWYAFMRTGREDIFLLAEKLSRHASEVDVYHMGKYKGLGSRHNVRHWGCPCKEARIAMAGHHRFYYYLTGDRRMEDIFAELKDNELTFLNKDPLGDFFQKEEMVYPSHARSGPDWSSLCINWMTQWERTLDERYREKIEIGMRCIKEAPLKLVSGPDFEFDPESVKLRYIGERTTGGTHLQICMGAPEIWMEMADLLDDEEWKQMMADYGRFYFLTEEQRQKETDGRIGDREFTFPFMAAAMGAYGAWYKKDGNLAKQVWCILMGVLANNSSHDGFASQILAETGNRKALTEISWISTNFVAQWCLNTIVALEFIREALPEDWEETDKLLAKAPESGFRKA